MDFKDLKQKLDRVIRNIGTVAQMDKVGKEVVEDIKSRTTKGFGVDKTGNNKKRLKKLSAQYKKQRTQLQKAGKLSDTTTPTRSNLTQSGEMVSSLESKAKKREVTVSVEGKKNRKKAEQQSKAGRKFMDLSKTELKKVLNIIEEDIKDDIKKNGL